MRLKLRISTWKSANQLKVHLCTQASSNLSKFSYQKWNCSRLYTDINGENQITLLKFNAKLNNTGIKLLQTEGSLISQILSVEDFCTKQKPIFLFYYAVIPTE